MSYTIVDYKDVLISNTDEYWLQKATNNIDLLLIDHAHCERKAAQNAMTLIFKFPNLPHMITKLSKIVREEMVHFERVLRFIKQRNITFRGLKSGGYATFLAQHICQDDPHNRLIDQLLVAAIIEARSCERLGLLASRLPESLGNYYKRLHDAEARHCTTFIEMAVEVAGEHAITRLQNLSHKESAWIQQKDDCFRFHSGVPTNIYGHKEKADVE